MRCPKCQYISFDEGARCRNCGYDFSLSEPEATLDLPIRGEEVQGPLDDFDLADRTRARSAPTPPPGRRPTNAGVGFELPLFTDDDAPLVTPPAVPRPPLSVRRSAPVTPRTPYDESQTYDEPPPSVPRRRAASPPRVAEPPPLEVDAAPAGLRLTAAGVDLAIVLGIDLAVVYFTLRAADLTFADVRALPAVPLAAFLLLLNGGYAVLFTAAVGQTIGKMLAGIRVVPDAVDGASTRLSLGTAFVREAACLMSLVPVGLGFFLAFMRADRRALHDTLASTRVVRA